MRITSSRLPNVFLSPRIDATVPSQPQGKARYLAVHVVLCFNELPSIDLPSVGLTRYDVALSLVQDFNWHTDRHLGRTLPVL